jgi:phosphoglycolate phosphatase-like HAD superfamily hydrolase
VKTFELLGARPAAQAAGIPLPRVEPIRAYVQSGAPLSNDGLRETIRTGGSEELARLLAWSESVDRAVEIRACNLPPFRPVRRTVEILSRKSDLMVCSQTPTETLVREWEHHDLRRFVRLIAGPEAGTKAQQLANAVAGGYQPGRILMVGDAPGDLEAARSVEACFFPIHPGDESRSWDRLRDEAYDRFLAGRYPGSYQQARIDAYLSLIPDTPPWEDGSG